MTNNEMREIADALANWFQSQEVSPLEAIRVMAMQIGLLLSIYAETEQHLDKGVDIMDEIIRQYAKLGWRYHQ